ncbi:MAG: DEAD/DEAH box helicase family protein, partial [Segatella copri]
NTTLTKVDTTSGEDNTTNENLVPQEQPQQARKFADGTEVPMTTDSKGRPTPDYASMTPEQSAEILTEDFGDNAEKVVDGQIQKAEKALKDAEKMKVDYTAEPNDIMEQEALKNQTIEAAKKQLDHAQNIKKAMTAKKVAETVERPVEPERAADGVAQEAGVVSPKVKERFEASKKIKGRRGSITLADGTKIRGTYYYGETSGLTTSHDPFNDFKQSEGFPVNEDGTSSNSRSYRDKESRLFTQKIGNDFNGLALKNVPVVQEGITLSGNGTVMGKKLAEQAGKDSKYYEDLEDNAEGFGWTPEQIKGAGFKGIVYFVPDEKLPLNSKTFDLFNKKETKSESNTEQAVKNAKTLTADEVGAIVAEIEGNGSLEAFFNNSKAINDLVKTLVDKGIIGQNEVAQMMDSPERLSAQGREYVKNLLLGSIFKPETIRMLGIDSTVKNKAINAIRSVMDNMKLGEFSLRDEIDQAIQLLYEARQGGNKVDTLLRTPSMFGEDAAKRYPSISQMMALALEGKVADFRDLLDEYNRIAAARNTGEGNVFGEAPTKPELIKEFLDFKKWKDYGTGHSENERGNDVSGVKEPKQEASGGNEPAEAGEGRVKSEDEDKPNSVGFTPKEIRDHQEKLDRAKDKYVKALSGAKSEKEIKAAEDEFEFTYKDHQNMNGVLDEASVADMWKKELESAKDSVKKDSKKLSADPMEALENAANAFHEEQKQKTEFKRNLEIGKARQEYEEAKKKGNADEISHAAGKLRNLLNEKYKAQGIGFEQRRKKIAEEIGKAESEIIDKPWEQMDLEEREAVSSKNPLTESEINELTSEENKELIPAALAYLRGDKGNIINAISYFKIWNDVRNRHENVSDNSGTENGTQLDAPDTTGGEGLGLGRGRESGRPDGPVDRGAGNEAAPGERNGREGDQNDTTLSAGEQGNKQGEGNSSGMGAVPAGSSDTNGGGSASGNGHVSGGSGRESSKRPADTNAGRKPTAKQGTTFPDSTAERLKQERADYEKKKKDFWARWKKAGQGYAKIALTPFKKLNLTPEQIEMLPELVKMHLNGAVLKIKEGIYKFNEWKAAMLAEEGEELKMIGLSDDDIDRFIEDYWNTPYEMDGETHTIREWSSIYGNQQLKKKLKEPLEEKYKRQMEAEPIEVKVGDMKNIEETLPYLLPQQQEDVLKAETQFFGKEHTDREHAYGKGYLFTNGTGTGKTYTGLGIAKRLAKQGKGRILFITPSQKKVSDWIKDGKNLGLDIKDLDSWAKERGTTATTESGEGMVITTFANFGLNKKLLETEWDAVIYDECHRIMENKKGTETARSMQHYMVTNRDENHCFQRLQSINPEYQKMNTSADKFNALRQKEIDRIKKEYKDSHPSATDKDVVNATLKSLPRELNNFAPADGMTFPKLGKAYQDFIKARDAYNKVEPKLKEQAKDSWKNTKTIFLSATPFNTRENLDYVEGYIFKYPETDERGMGGRTQFYLNHFGAAYKFRYHRLEQSISNPDAVAKQEVAFSDYLQNTLGTMSGRIIDSPYDYSRDFPTVAPDHAEDFNNAVQDTLKTKYLHDAYSKTIGDYNYGSALFETMKVSAAIDRIKQHLDLGRKVVIFHRRVESKEPLEAPFAYMLRVANEQIKMMKPGKERDEYIKECTEFRNKYADLLEWEKTLDYSMPREQIAKVFGEKNVLFFSGKESKKVKDKAIDTFNDDDSGKNIIVIQEASGKEGISLHDTTSKHQRVCITLALPQSPITALQIEGRIYRIGNMSNAIFEYPILGLNSEMMLFGEKFNNQVSTTENLALGSQARNLRDSFANGILEHSGIVPVENQGVGGKEFDAATPSENDPFDNAVLDYYSNQKLNKNNREGIDYFPTPEPLGYKMVEWAGLGEGDSVLEPSAGHGAIARYVPKTNEMVSIEPSQSLFTKLQLKAGGLGRKFLNNTFENYALNNKHDVIVMNPPFGKAGALAIQHVDKAFKHLDEGGRIVAIIPRGSTDKKFDNWYNEQKNVAMRAEVNLPDILFQQAGTRVACRVVVLDKISDAALRSKEGYPEKIDLSGHYDKIEDFFNDLRDIEMPDRIIDTNLKMQKKAKAAVKDIMEIKGVKNVSYGKTGIDVSLTGSWMNYGISFTGSDKPNYWRDKMA